MIEVDEMVKEQGLVAFQLKCHAYQKLFNPQGVMDVIDEITCRCMNHRLKCQIKSAMVYSLDNRSYGKWLH